MEVATSILVALGRPPDVLKARLDVHSTFTEDGTLMIGRVRAHL